MSELKKNVHQLVQLNERQFNSYFASFNDLILNRSYQNELLSIQPLNLIAWNTSWQDPIYRCFYIISLFQV